jgi:hypothetical protein
MRLISLDHRDGEMLFAIGMIDQETIAGLCVDALAKGPTGIRRTRLVRVLRAVSPYDGALHPSERKKEPQ